LPNPPQQYILVVEKQIEQNDIVGFFSQKEKLEKRRFRLDRSERFHFVCCVKFNKVKDLLHNIKEEKR
jgi:hypothetical protein